MSDLIILTNLSLPNANISDLTGLEKCVNLQALDLTGNAIQNLDPITPLNSKLLRLNLSHNNLQSLTGLETLSNLTNLE